MHNRLVFEYQILQEKEKKEMKYISMHACKYIYFIFYIQTYMDIYIQRYFSGNSMIKISDGC